MTGRPKKVFRVRDVERTLSRLRAFVVFDALEILDDDGSVLHAALSNNGWGIELRKAAVREDDLLEIHLLMDDVQEGLRCLEERGGVALRRWRGSAKPPGHRFGQLQFRLHPR